MTDNLLLIKKHEELRWLEKVPSDEYAILL